MARVCTKLNMMIVGMAVSLSVTGAADAVIMSPTNPVTPGYFYMYDHSSYLMKTSTQYPVYSRNRDHETVDLAFGIAHLISIRLPMARVTAHNMACRTRHSIIMARYTCRRAA